MFERLVTFPIWMIDWVSVYLSLVFLSFRAWMDYARLRRILNYPRNCAHHFVSRSYGSRASCEALEEKAHDEG